MGNSVSKIRVLKFSKSNFSLISDEIIELKKTVNIKEYAEKQLTPTLNSFYSVFIPVEGTDEKPFFVI